MSWWSAGPHLWHINIINHARQLFYFQSSKKSYVTMEQFPWSYTKIKDLPCLISSEERPYKWLVSVADKLFTSFFLLPWLYFYFITSLLFFNRTVLETPVSFLLPYAVTICVFIQLGLWLAASSQNGHLAMLTPTGMFCHPTVRPRGPFDLCHNSF